MKANVRGIKMTEDEMEAQSTRYIAPRIMRLSSGRIAIIPMIGREPPRFIEAADFTIDMIPTDDQLTAYKEVTEAAMKRRAEPAAKPKPTLDDLA